MRATIAVTLGIVLVMIACGPGVSDEGMAAVDESVPTTTPTPIPAPTLDMDPKGLRRFDVQTPQRWNEATDEQKRIAVEQGCVPSDWESNGYFSAWCKNHILSLLMSPDYQPPPPGSSTVPTP